MTKKRFLLGESGGKICDNSSELYVYDLSLVTVIDTKDSDDAEDIYEETRKKIDNYRFRNSLNDISGESLSSPDGTEFEVTVTKQKPPYEGPRYSLHSDDSLTSSISKSKYKDIEIIDDISSQGLVTDPVQATDNVDNAEELLEEFDIDKQVESIKKDYNKEAVEVRKPTEKEIGRIVDSIIERFEDISRKEGKSYFKNTPEFWEEATCCKCPESDEDIYYLSRKKMKSVFMKQMKEGFGITEDEKSRRTQTSKKISNFYVSRSGEVFFRPEELISWIIDDIHKVEPLCETCHSEVGGPRHSKVTNQSKTKEVSKEISNSPSSFEDTQENHIHTDHSAEESISFNEDIDSINIETYEEVSPERWDTYRNPKPSETEDITKRILHHLYSLGTRKDASYKSQRSGTYSVIMSRGVSKNREDLELFNCTDCGITVEDEQKHHPVLISLREAHMDVMNTIDVPPEMNPILVNESENEYILSHKFLWRIESHLRNLDISAFKCSKCSSKEQKDSISMQGKKISRNSNTSDAEIKRADIKDKISHLNPDIDRREIMVQCSNCEVLREGKIGNNIECRMCNDGTCRTPRGKSTPLFRPEKINIPPEKAQAEYIGACSAHIEKLVDLVHSKTPNSDKEVRDYTKESLRLMFNNK